MNAVLQTKSKLPGFISLLLVVALGISLAKLMWLIITPTQEINIRTHSEAVAVVNQKKQANYGKLIADQHIFGEVKKTKAAKEIEPPKAAVVAPIKLNLKLHGIVAYQSKEGFALISISNGPQKVYGKGESLEEDVTVREILPDKVVLDNHGQVEELLLPIKKAKPSTSKRSGLSFGDVNDGTLPPDNEPQISPLTAVNSNNNVADLGALKQEIISNPSKLTDIVRSSPAIVNGQFIGFRIQPGRKRKLFRQLKFRPNDIITEINGIVLDDISKSTQALSELARAVNISVKVKRGNQEVLIEHSL